MTIYHPEGKPMSLEALDSRILQWERKLLHFGRSDRADYIVHMLNLLRTRRMRLEADAQRCNHSGGVGIGAGHECRCNRPKGHPLDSDRPHGCPCGAPWADTPPIEQEPA